MRAQRKVAGEVFNNPILIGTITLLVALVAVYLSYIAENGLPFVPTYTIYADVQDAAQLVKNSDVRVGGARIGQVLKITPEVATKQWPHPYAELQLSLQKTVEPLPYDTKYEIRLNSVLGGKYVEIVPGHDQNTPATPSVPDGGTFTLNVHGPSRNIPVVDLDTAFKTFGPKTQRGLRNAVQALGDAVAGRGVQFNDAVYSLRRLFGPLDNILRLLASSNTHLSAFISGAAATTGALAPVAPAFTSLLAAGSTTFAALTAAGPALGSTIDQLPATESLGTTVLTNAEPVLADAASIVQDLKPGAVLLPRASRSLDAILRAATPVFKLTPQLATSLQTALTVVGKLAGDPATVATFKLLGKNDLASAGADALVGLGSILQAAGPAQLGCNTIGIWARNAASTLGEGDASGNWIRANLVFDLPQNLQATSPASDLHANPYPVEQAGTCTAGNEQFTTGQRIGPPVGLVGSSVENTTPPAGVLARGQAAGLVP